MSLRSILIVVVLVLLVAFAAVNWTAFNTPMHLSLLVATIEAPLGLIMLFVTALLALLFLFYIVYLQTSVLLDARRNAKELQSQRELADRAEASRFTDLRNYLEQELNALRVANQATGDAIAARVELAERTLRDELEQTANSLSAYIGELEDRLEHGQRQS
ncbi:MAG TPA: LapA family protein [Burkholderiales bacterium]|nr:LapA family protein [Burkholderiales bacterium]